MMKSDKSRKVNRRHFFDRLFSNIFRPFIAKTPNLSPFATREFQAKDLQQVFRVETEAFHGENYPKFFFIQSGELFPNTFFVAESNQGEIIGYGIGAIEQEHPDTGWILSMGVLPTWKKQGVGTAIMHSLLSALEKLGVKRIKLSTSETNIAAFNLYSKLGFSTERHAADYFGDDETRLIMYKTIITSGGTTVADNSELLMGETEISVSFVNVLFGVSMAVVAILATRSDVRLFALPFYYLFLTIFASFYASIFYANASGNISRLGRLPEVNRPLQLGNVISEYLGVYPLIISFPLTVWNITNDTVITVLALVVDLGGFLLYQFSGFDILSRVVAKVFVHRSITLAILALTAVQLIAEIRGWLAVEVVLAILLSSLLALLVIVGIRTSEHGSTS